MFESAELHQVVSKNSFDAALPDIRSRLLAAQRALRASKRSVIVVVSGVENAGKSTVVNRLHEWLDARGLSAHTFWRDSEEDRERPRYWRFWRTLPPRGTIGILFGSWYTQPIVDRVFRKSGRAAFDREMQRIAFFERMLALDGAVMVKLWLHLPKDEEERRLTTKPKGKKRSFYTPMAKKYARQYERFAAVSERAIRMTDTAEAPWTIIEATDPRYRDLTVATVVLEALENAVKSAPPSGKHDGSLVTMPAKGPTVLDQVDLAAKVDLKKYDKQLEKLQAKLGTIAWDRWNAQQSAVILFEGWDAAGKGGAIRRIIGPIDARLYRVISIAAPTDEERAQHYLWRFWRQIPRAGAITVYDRSWYGRVLVERVEGFATADEWSRAYREVNDFEEQLVEHGIALIKFWLHIDPKEQLRRFRERQKIAWKQHKITDEDWRNREKWDPYRLAVHDMITHTSTEIAPWTVIAANDKRLARLEVLRTVVERLGES